MDLTIATLVRIKCGCVTFPVCEWFYKYVLKFVAIELGDVMAK